MLPKINSNSYGGKWLGIGFLVGVIVPSLIWCIWHVLLRWLVLLGGVILASFFVLLFIENRQDNGIVPYYEAHLAQQIPFDPACEEAVIRCSICSGERIAGFLNRETGHFTEVMVLKNDEDEQRFKRIYGLRNVKAIY